MGNFSELYLTNLVRKPLRGELETTSPYLLAKYQLPIAWLALFDQSDIHELPIDDSLEKWPYLIRSKKSALALLRSRQPWLTSHFPLLASRWLDAFIDFLDAAPFEYVHLETSDIGGMGHSGAEWTKEMRNMLGCFSDWSQPPTIGPLADTESQTLQSPWEAYCAFFSGAYDSPKCELPYCYVGGSGSDTPAPWETLERRLGGDKETPAVTTEPVLSKTASPLLVVDVARKVFRHTIGTLLKRRNLIEMQMQTSRVAPNPSDQSAPIVTENENLEQPGLYVGQHVSHFKFGPGIVEALSGSGDDEIVSVKFDSGETKWLSVKYAQLQLNGLN